MRPASLSYVLRHEPQAIGLTLDSEGWVDINALITCACQKLWQKCGLMTCCL
ncbi:RNA 2'-phosphotransferase [Budvicia diplopodorum]|uniref:RNA 2'-phosphotransferase n=1 Tax=Budvicia diplopodorum TaxID=1119056 RepID=UPI0031B58585